MKYDPKCYELAAHFLPYAKEDDRKELAELFQWFGDLHVKYGAIAPVTSQTVSQVAATRMMGERRKT